MIVPGIVPGMNGNARLDELQRSPQLANDPAPRDDRRSARAPIDVPTLAKPIRLDKLMSLVALAHGQA
jgi:hypothetical protein